jgi:phosphoglycolate phosphatase
MRYDAIIFDFDGTLVATARAVFHCISKVLTEAGYREPSYLDVRRTIGMRLPDAFQQLTNYEGAHRCDAQQLMHAYRDIYVRKGHERTLVFEGACEVLRDLHREGIEVAVVSNKGEAAIVSSLKRFGLQPFVTAIIADDGREGPKKPDPWLYTDQIRPLLSVASDQEVLVVGDTATDLIFAKRAALDVCWASYGYGDRSECMPLAPTYEIARLSDLLAVLGISGT